MKVKNDNQTAVTALAFGIIGALVTGVLGLLLASLGDALGVLPVIIANGLAWWTLSWGLRNAEAATEYDAAGIRHHGQQPWDLPWAQIRSLRWQQVRGARHLEVQPEPDAEPVRLISYQYGKQPTRPEAVLPATGPRVRSTTRRFSRPRLALAGSLLLAGYLIVAVLDTANAWQTIAVWLGLVGTALLAFGLPRRRSLAVVDWHGIRRVGAQNWTLPWSQIISAQVISDTLVVQPLDEPEQGKGLIQDSYLPETDAAATNRPPGFGLLRRLAARTAQREALTGDDLTTSPVDSKDAPALQAAIDEHRDAWQARASTMIEQPDPADWPQLGDREPSDPSQAELQDEYQPGQW